jgi:hypothetical protein
MSAQHKDLAAGRWNDFSLMDQLANIGSEVSRTIGWKRRNNLEQADRAFERSLELFDLTLSCPRNASRSREIARARECWADFQVGSNQYSFTEKYWEEYFLQFGIAARLHRN